MSNFTKLGPKVLVAHLQFIRTSKTLAAIVPRADKRSIARMPPQVCSQVGRLAVYLSTTLVVAYVDFPLILANSVIVIKL